ncbi:MAG: hypothetical protein KF820_07395 [Candidatus Paracaedibacteraceae bacterium]|nr:hypothetical protein [Candidatus Paracaedibacteraceae bacterium]
MRKSTLFVCVVAALIGFGLFQLKYEVMNLEGQYKQINREIRVSEESVSVLKAEWAHLTSPAALQNMARKHLGVDTVTPKQLVSLKRRVNHNKSSMYHDISLKAKPEKQVLPEVKAPDSELDMMLDEAIKEINYRPVKKGRK